MSWYPDIETSFGENMEFLYRNTQYELVPDIETTIGGIVEFLYTNTEYEVDARY